MNEPIFAPWRPEDSEGWGKRPLRLAHTLHRHPLFSLDGLAELIERYPREHYALVHMGAQGERRLWREGDIGDLAGREVIDAIAKGRMWLNLRRVSAIERQFGEILDSLFEEVNGAVPGGYQTFSRTSGILISSPKAQVYYHADLPGQSLWQIHGRKRVYVYPATAPFLTPEQLENIALHEVEVDLAYDASYDQGAVVFDLEPGQMLHWPLNAPHRVENHDCLNVSMTTEYWTEAIRRSQMINMANGLLRQKLHMAPRSRSTEGAVFWAKAALQAGVRRSGLLKQTRRARRPIDFRLDRQAPDRIVDIPPRPMVG